MEKLYPHNRRAAEAVLKGFENEEFVAVVHATGTGKSYIIAEVARHFGKVLVVAPNNFVLEETRKLVRNDNDTLRYDTLRYDNDNDNHGEERNVEFRTYAGVMYDENPCGDYELIVLDEFHRAGADKWGEGVKNLLERNKGAKVLGTSATHIRYLDNERNMADELFDGNVVSYLPLKQAMDEGILPTPTYVASLYEIDSTRKMYEQGIKRLRKDDGTKADLSRKLKGITENWDQAHGVPTIMRKYFSKDMKRVIVFCSKVSHAKQSKAMLRQWFEEAGFKKVYFYTIDYQQKRVEREMQGFQDDVEEGAIKVAISVNMLNEGVHVPRVDAIIMLRSTISRIIIEQQIGRCLTADNKNRKPVVLDLVNNMDLIDFRAYNFDNWNSKDTHGEKDSDGFPFKVIDECRDIRTFLEQMDSILYGHHTKEECLESARRYTSRYEWLKNDNILYNYSVKHGWHEECCAHMPPPMRYTKEDCMKIASKYKKRCDWKKAEGGSYGVAYKRGWLEDCCAHMLVFNKPISKEECIATASKYETKSEWKDASPGTYSKARKSGWLDECCKHMKCMIHHYSKDECIESARKYNTRGEWQKCERFFYSSAQQHGWLDECCAHMKVFYKKYTKEDCINTAKLFTTRTMWKKQHPCAYAYAIRNNILDECCAHMTPPPRRYTKEECMANAKKYATSGDWYKNDNSYYSVAHRHGWFEECTAHMKVTKHTRTKEDCIENAKQYGTFTEWNKKEDTIVSYARKHGWIEECKAVFGN